MKVKTKSGDEFEFTEHEHFFKVENNLLWVYRVSSGGSNYAVLIMPIDELMWLAVGEFEVTDI